MFFIILVSGICLFFLFLFLIFFFLSIFNLFGPINRYYPDKHWAITLPFYIAFCLFIVPFFYAGVNLLITAPLSSSVLISSSCGGRKGMKEALKKHGIIIDQTFFENLDIILVSFFSFFFVQQKKSTRGVAFHQFMKFPLNVSIPGCSLLVKFSLKSSLY